MRTKLFLTIGILLLVFMGHTGNSEIKSKNNDKNSEFVTIICTPDLYDLTMEWVSKYAKLNPSVMIKVIKASSNNNEYDIGETLYFTSNKNSTVFSNEENWKIVLGREILIPFINKGNPFINEIKKQGISQELFTQIINNQAKQNWGTVLGEEKDLPMHIYISNNEVVKEGVARFIKSEQLPVSTGIMLGSETEVIAEMRNDPSAIGFCKLISIQGSDSQGLAGNFVFLPIDKNGNGSLDNMENIYADLNTFQRGIWIGKYPKSLFRNIYAVCSVQPENENELEFLKWVITEGQQYLIANGYCELVGSESQSQLDKLTIASVNIVPVKNTSQAGIIILILAVVLCVGLVVSAVVRNYRKQKNVTPDFNISQTGFSIDTLILPNGLYFDKSHTWSFMEKDGNITVGIDDFLQHITGPVTRIEMKSLGDPIRKGDVLFSIIQFGKQLNIYAPFSGIIKKQNVSLISDSSAINSSPYEAGWIYSIEPSNWIKEVQLMDLSEKYRRWLSAEFIRLKEFMKAILRPESQENTHLVLQDGGELKEGVLADFGPKVWEDFQAKFLDTFK